MSMGHTKDNVFPEPVGAHAKHSRPCIKSEIKQQELLNTGDFSKFDVLKCRGALSARRLNIYDTTFTDKDRKFINF